MSIIVTGSFDLDPANRDAAIEVFTDVHGRHPHRGGQRRLHLQRRPRGRRRFHVVEHRASQEAIDGTWPRRHLAELMGAMGGLGVTGVSLTQWNGATAQKLM